MSTAEQRRLRARLAAYASHAGYPPGERTQQLRTGLEALFVRKARELYPDADEAEIARQAGLLRKAHYTKLSLAAADARARKAKRA